MAAAEKARVCGGSRRFERAAHCGIAAALLLGLAGFLAAAFLSVGASNGAAPRTTTNPLQQLWKQYPLRPSGTGTATGARAGAERAQRQPQSRRVAGDQGGLSTTWVLLISVGTGIAVFVALMSLRNVARRRGRRARGKSEARVRPRPAKGGSEMANLRRKLRALTETNAPTDGAKEDATGEGAQPASPVDRLSAYSLNEPVPTETDVTAEPPAGEEPDPVEAEAPPDLAAVGEEVTTILKSAQEAAARIRRTAQKEAERLRAETESTAVAELDDVRGIAEAERAEASRIRAEAEAYAKDTRAAADAFSEERRTEAEREAAKVGAEAQKRLEAADAEAERKIRQAEASGRQRREALQAEAGRYEERLENMLAVFQGMSSQLEDLLGKGRAGTGDAPEASDEELEDALRPDRPSSRVG
jgi:hypothetical protein